MSDLDALNYTAAVICAVGGFTFAVWREPIMAVAFFVAALVNVALAVFTP